MFNYETIQKFTEIEKVIYEYVLQNKEKVQYMRVRDIAEQTHVSPASVIRFVNKCGFDSFTEFKLMLKEEQAQKGKQKIFDTREIVEEFFTRTLNKDYDQLLDQAASIIASSNQVIFLGIGSSGILAEYGSRQLSNLGRRTFYVKDPFYPFRHSSENFSGSVTIILSVSGETPQILSQAEILKELGSKIISITNTSQNTLSKLSEVNLSYHLTPEMLNQHVNITSQVPVVYLLETLARKTMQ